MNKRLNAVIIRKSVTRFNLSSMVHVLRTFLEEEQQKDAAICPNEELFNEPPKKKSKIAVCLQTQVRIPIIRSLVINFENLENPGPDDLKSVLYEIHNFRKDCSFLKTYIQMLQN